MQFKLIKKETPVDIETPDGRVLNCKLVELSGDERTKYMNSMISKMRVDHTGRASGFKTFDGVESDLVGMSLRGPDGKTFTKKELDEFPSSVMKALFDEAQRLSALDAEAEKTAKND